GALRVEAVDDGRGVRRDLALEDPRPGRRRDPLRPDDVLAGPRNPGKERRVARGKPRIGGTRLRTCVVVREVKPGVMTVRVRPGKCEVGELNRAGLTSAQ